MSPRCRRVAVVVLAVSAFVCGPPVRAGEPLYFGRTLHEWVADLKSPPAAVSPRSGWTVSGGNPLAQADDDVIATLGSIGEPAVGPLLESLKSSDPLVRERAAAALAAMGPEARGAVDSLIGALKDSSVGVRAKVVEALGQIGSDAKAAVPALIPLLRDEQCGSEAAEALADIGEPAVGPVAELLADKDPGVRLAGL